MFGFGVGFDFGLYYWYWFVIDFVLFLDMKWFVEIVGWIGV